MAHEQDGRTVSTKEGLDDLHSVVAHGVGAQICCGCGAEKMRKLDFSLPPAVSPSPTGIVCGLGAAVAAGVVGNKAAAAAPGHGSGKDGPGEGRVSAAVQQQQHGPLAALFVDAEDVALAAHGQVALAVKVQVPAGGRRLARGAAAGRPRSAAQWRQPERRRLQRALGWSVRMNAFRIGWVGG